MNFGEKIKDLRIKNNLTQQDFADKFFVTRQAVSRWEQGKSIPGIDVLELIAKEFNVSIDYLISEDDSIKQAEEKELQIGDNTSNVITNKSKNYNAFMNVTFYGILAILIMLVIFVIIYFSTESLRHERYAIYVSPTMVSKEDVKNNRLNWQTLGENYYLSSDEGSWYIYSCHEIGDNVDVEFVEQIFSTNDYFASDIIITKKSTINGVETVFNYYRAPDVIEIIGFDVYGTFLKRAYYSKDDIREYKEYHIDHATTYTIKAYYNDNHGNINLLFNYNLKAEGVSCDTSIYLPSNKALVTLQCFKLF